MRRLISATVTNTTDWVITTTLPLNTPIPWDAFGGRRFVWLIGVGHQIRRLGIGSTVARHCQEAMVPGLIR